MLAMSHKQLSNSIAMQLERIGRLIDAECFTEQLPPVQWSALRYLAHHSTTKQTISSLTSFSGVNHSSASRTVAILVKKGLVSADRGQGADRSLRLSVTQKGWELLENDPLNHIVAMVATLPYHEQAALHNTLNCLLSRMVCHPESR